MIGQLTRNQMGVKKETVLILYSESYRSTVDNDCRRIPSAADILLHSEVDVGKENISINSTEVFSGTSNPGFGIGRPLRLYCIT